MPFANLKVPANTISDQQKKDLIDTVTEAYVTIWGEQARPNVLVLVEEVGEGGWGIGGNVLTADMLNHS